MSARLKFLRRSRDPKKGVGTRLTPLVAAPPPNLTRLVPNTAILLHSARPYVPLKAMVQSFSSTEPVVS